MEVKINKVFPETSFCVWEINFIFYFYASVYGEIYLTRI